MSQGVYSKMWYSIFLAYTIKMFPYIVRTVWADTFRGMLRTIQDIFQIIRNFNYSPACIAFVLVLFDQLVIFIWDYGAFDF